MKLSIIIPTRNRARYLEQTLKSLLNQTISQNDYEVIIIDNGSEDNTKEICLKYKTKFIYFKYIYDKRPGLHVGRNRGFIESKSDNLLFADDDVIGFPTWLEGIIESLESEDVALAGGNVIPQYEDNKPVWLKDLTINDGQYHIVPQLSVIWSKSTKKSYINPHYVLGCNFGIKRAVLQQCGGFHPDGMPRHLLMYRGDGESGVSQYIEEKRFKAVFNPKASVYHIVPKERTTEKYLAYRGLRDGVSNMYRTLRNKGWKAGFHEYIKFRSREIWDNRYNKLYLRWLRRGKRYLFNYYLLYPKIREWVKRDNYIV